jgi:hypothetical protein
VAVATGSATVGSVSVAAAAGEVAVASGSVAAGDVAVTAGAAAAGSVAATFGPLQAVSTMAIKAKNSKEFENLVGIIHLLIRLKYIDKLYHIYHVKKH